MTGVWLGIDTATETASVALSPDGPTRGGEAAVVLGEGRPHGADLLVLVDRVLAQAGRRLADVAGIVVGDGPGSFTGLRVGWATAKGLAQEAALPVIAIPSMMGLARAYADAARGGAIAVCYDALRGAVYGALYRFAPGRVTTLLAPQVLTVAELGRVAPERAVIAVGDGARRYAADIAAWLGHGPIDVERADGRRFEGIARWLLALRNEGGASRALSDLTTAEPVYGRPAEAQARGLRHSTAT